MDLVRQASLLLLLKHSVWDFISNVISLWEEEPLEVLKSDIFANGC